MANAKGRGVRVEVALTYGSPKTITEVTAANPGVASSTAHGLTAKTVGYFATATGMPQLEGQACRVGASPATDSFTLEGLNTSSYGDFSAGSFVPVATWGVLYEATSYSKTGGEPAEQDVTNLIHEISQTEAGMLSAEKVQIDGRMETVRNAAAAVVDAAALAGDYCVFRVTLKDGSVRYWRGQPGRRSENLSTGQVGTGAFSTNVRGLFMEGAA